MPNRILISIVLAALLSFGCGKKAPKEVEIPTETGVETAPVEAPPVRETSSEQASATDRTPAERTPEAAPPKATPAGRKTDEGERGAVRRPAARDASREGVVTFLSGEVKVDRGAGWTPLDVEDAVRVDDRVRTGPDSFCEIQFSDFGIVRVQDNAEVLLGEVTLKEGEGAVGMKLDGGNILCKVSKLGKGEKFEVRTNTALAGVRGTEFVVKEASGETVVAVNEGRVSVIPSEIVEKIENLKGELQTDAARSVLERIALPEIILSDRKEVALERKEMEAVVRKFDEVAPVLERKIMEIDRKAATVAAREERLQRPGDKSAEDSARELAEVRKEKQNIETLSESVVAQVEEKSAEIRQTLEQPESVSKTSLRELQEIKRMKPMDLVVASKEEPAGGAGAGPREGERGQRREEAPARPVYAKVSIEVSPRDAEIFVNDENVGKARYSGLFPPGSILVIRAVREGYKTHVYKYTVNEREKRQQITIELRSPVSWELKGGGSPFVRKAASSGKSAVFADRKGRLVCVSTDGKALWSYATKNDPNENSMPLVVDDRVVFSGDAELVAVSLKSGGLLKSVSLGRGRYSSHFFGRRVVDRKGTLLFPSDEAILFLNVDSMEETRAIGLPGESQCTPAVFGEKIVTVDLMGVLLLIDAATGEVETGIETDAFRPASVAPTVIGTKAVFADTRGSVTAVDLEKKELLWHRSLGEGKKGVFTDVEYDGDRLYVYNGEEFYTLSLEDGRDLFSPVRSSCLPLAGGERLYYGDMDGRLLVVDALTGNVVKSTKLASPVSAQPLLTGEGVLVGSASGAIRMIKLEDL